MNFEMSHSSDLLVTYYVLSDFTLTLEAPLWLRWQSLPAMQETWVRSPGWEDPLEKEMATHSSTLAWKIPWMEEPSRYSLWG